MSIPSSALEALIGEGDDVHFKYGAAPIIIHFGLASGFGPWGSIRGE